MFSISFKSPHFQFDEENTKNPTTSIVCVFFFVGIFFSLLSIATLLRYFINICNFKQNSTFQLRRNALVFRARGKNVRNTNEISFYVNAIWYDLSVEYVACYSVILLERKKIISHVSCYSSLKLKRWLLSKSFDNFCINCVQVFCSLLPPPQYCLHASYLSLSLLCSDALHRVREAMDRSGPYRARKKIIK